MVPVAAMLSLGDARADIPKAVPLAPPPVMVPPAPLPPKPAPPLPKVPKVRAVPAEKPGNWFGADDYPAQALRLGLSGLVNFRLYLDLAGKVSHCQITGSSEFEILDDAVCALITRRAQFVPARDAKGQPAPDIWDSRFFWRIPEGTDQPLLEMDGAFRLSVSQIGAVTSCVLEFHQPASMDDSVQCPNFDNLPRVAGLEMRGYGPEPSVEVLLHMANAFTEQARDKALDHKPGYEVRSVLVFRLEMDTTGTVMKCALVKQRGSPSLMRNACADSFLTRRFSPVKTLNGPPVSTPIWHVERILRKLGP